MSRIAVIFGVIGPYHVARLSGLSERAEVVAIEMFERSVAYAWEIAGSETFQRVTLFPGSVRSISTIEIENMISQTFDEHSVDAVALPGWSESYSIAAIRIASKKKIPIIMMSESQRIDFKRNYFSELIKSRIVSLCQAGLVGGGTHRDYLENLGMNRNSIYFGYDVVDNEYFSQQSKKVRSDEALFREKFGLPEFYFFASARFIPKKNLEYLISAFSEYRRRCISLNRDKDECWHLVLLGDGDLRPKLESLVNELKIEPYIHMPGFKQITDLPVYYALSKCFVHASTTEQWGLVVNEAMASGLPVIVSERCGCAFNLVENDQNGFRFNPYDVEALVLLMLNISKKQTDRALMGEKSREIISKWSPETFADGMLNALDAALAASKKQPNFLDRLLLRLIAKKNG